MRLRRPALVDVVVAALCAGFTAVFVAGEGALLLLTAPLVFVAVLARRRLPLAAALGVPAIAALHGVLDLPGENPAMLAPWLVVAYSLGRYAGWRASVAGLGTLVLLALVSSDPGFRIGNAVFGGIVFAGSWAFGYVVRRRTDDARRAIVEADELATLDPAERAAQVVAEERARLAGEVVRVVRAGVTAMQRHAAAAEADLDRVALESVQEEGRRAVAELRRLLGLLRADEPPAAVREPTPRRRWPLDVAVTGGLAGLFMLEFHFGLGPLSWGSAAAGLVAVGAVAVRRIEPMLACLVALVAVALAGVLGQPFPHVVTTAAGFVLLAWSVAVRARWRAYAALGALTVVVAADVYRSEPANVVITLAAFALGGLAGHLWAAADRRGRDAAAAAAALRSERDAVAARAVQAERLRLARELHDVASHAVGVMVLQAGAARAVCAQHPDRAREAVRTVRATAVEALRELDVLAGLLNAGAVGPAGLVDAAPERDLGAALHALAGRIRAAGVDLWFTVTGPLPEDQDLAATVYRIVQEGLTNAARYAFDSRVEVEIRGEGGLVEVEVRDDGGGSPSTPSEPGFGLVGLAERVRALGGEFAAGPGPSGGFTVSSRLPVGASSGVEG